MASERDREIWDDATNAVCQAMQEQKMCNCPDGDCLAAKIDFSPEKIATATRPAPAATDTGLVTFSVEVTSSGHPYMKSDPDGDYVTRSQAAELLAEKDKIIERHREAQVILGKQIDEVIADNAAKDAQIAGWTESGKLWTAEIRELQADNAALTARIKELEWKAHNATISNKIGEDSAPMLWSEYVEALEAKLAAARKALTEIYGNGDATGCNPQIKVDIARAALEVKP